MGYRALLEFVNNECSHTLYLHWNGGRESVEAFLRAARDLRLPDNDQGHRTLHAMIDDKFGSAYFEDGCCSADGDNGTYVVSEYRVIGRKFENPDWGQQTELAQLDSGYGEGERAERGRNDYDTIISHPLAQARKAELAAEKLDAAIGLVPVEPVAKPLCRTAHHDFGAPEPLERLDRPVRRRL